MGEFEKDIKEMFEDLHVPIDTGALWEEISEVLDKKDRKVVPLWWWISSGIILVAAIMAIFIFNNRNNNDNKKEKHNTSLIIKTGKDTVKDNGLPGLPMPAKKQEDKPSIPQTKEAKHTKPHVKNNKKQSIPVAATGTYSGYDIAAGNNNTAGGSEAELSSSDISTADVRSDKRQISPVASLNNNIAGVKYDDSYVLDLNFKPVTKDIPKPKQNWLAFDKSVDFALGASLVHKSLALQNDDYAWYRQKRYDTEKYLESVNGNVRVNFMHRSGLYITTGLDLTLIDEKFSSIDSVDIKGMQEGVTKEIINGNGTADYSTGMKEYIIHKKWDKLIYNYYAFVDIPLLIGYNFDIKNVKMEVDCGVSYNIAFVRKGQILGQEGYPVDIGQENNIFKANTGISLLSGIKVFVPFKNKEFYIEPNVKYNLDPVTASSYPVEQRYFNYGIKTGYRMVF